MKKILLSLLACGTLTAAAQNEIIMGDMNGDGVLSVEDVTLLTSTLLGERDMITYVCLPDDNTQSYTVNGVTFKMKLVEHGTFQMCFSPDGVTENPVHSVTISKDYYIGQTEVTQALWYAVMGQKPTSAGSQWEAKYGLGDRYPAYYVSWNDCQAFITKLNELTGKTFRMPTEAEWEFAAKGGNKSKGYIYSGSNTIADVAWYYDNASKVGDSNPDYGLHRVATKLPNELGLYDMTGNVREFCSDLYGPISDASVTDPTGNPSGTNYLIRGGAWNSYAAACRANYRNSTFPTNLGTSFGLRLALSAAE